MSRMNWAATCDYAELPVSRSLSSRLERLAPPLLSIETDQESTMLQLPVEALVAIFQFLPPRTQRNFALVCESFNAVRNGETTHIDLFAGCPDASFYKRLFERRPRLRELVLHAVGRSRPCRHVDLAAVAMRDLSPDVRLELCNLYAVPELPSILEVCRKREWAVTPFSVLYARRQFVQLATRSTSVYFFFSTALVGSTSVPISAPLSAAGFSQLLETAVAGKTKHLILEPRFMSQIAGCVEAAPINCKGVRYQSKQRRWAWKKGYRRLPSAKRAKSNDTFSDSGDDHTPDNEDDADQDYFDDEDDYINEEYGTRHDLEWDQDMQMHEAIEIGLVTHCDCGRCPSARLPIDQGATFDFDRAEDRIAPRCDCIHGLVTDGGSPIMCMCNQHIFSLDDLLLLTRAAVARPAVCRQPIYRRLAFYPLLQSLHTNE